MYTPKGPGTYKISCTQYGVIMTSGTVPGTRYLAPGTYT